MPPVYRLVEMRRRRRTLAQRNPLPPLGITCGTLLALAMALSALLAAWFYAQATFDLPSLEALPLWLSPPNGLLLQPTRLYDRSGQHLLVRLQNPAAAGSRYLYLPQNAPPDQPAFSPALIQATLAALDPDFWEHPGVSWKGLFRQEPTTIAQRLVGELLLADEPPSLRRALRERLLAIQVTHRYGREQVLEWYLNSAPFGRLTYGADAAARLYLGKSAGELDLAEAALLAATLRNPTLNPQDAPQAALEGQKRLLQAMLEQRLAPPAELARAAQERLAIRPAERPGQAFTVEQLEPKVAPLFAHLALEQVSQEVPRQRLERGGLILLTTLDHTLQTQLTCLLALQASRYGGLLALPTYEECPAASLLPPPTGDLANLPLIAQGMMLDPQSGQILALVESEPISLVAEAPARHPVGTLATTFLYLTAFRRGFSPATLVWDLPPPETPLQRMSDYHGPVRLRLAFANDYLRPAEDILAQVGIENVWNTAEELGLPQPQPAAPSSPPSAASLLRPLSIVEVGQAFGIFAHQGLLAGRATSHSLAPQGNEEAPPLQPTFALRLDDVAGNAWFTWSTTQQRPVLSPPLAYLITHALSDEIVRWPRFGHPNPLEIGRPAAAKVGSDPDGRHAWVVGYTPQLVTVIHLGIAADAPPSPERASQLLSAAMGVYSAAMKYAHQGRPVQGWTAPPGIVTLKVCDPSGLLPTAACPNVVEEVFLEGNQPLQADRLFRTLAINRESGRLATVFTPPDLIVERSFLTIPAEAQTWAEQAGFASPPQVYDPIPLLPPPSPQLHLTSPAMFSVVRGTVSIRGSVQLEDLDFYRLQVGEGLNPQTWLQIGEDGHRAIQEGELAVWDTGDLNGVYTVELLAVRRDRRVERALAIVTVDNQPPALQVLAPLPQEEIALQQRPTLVFLAEAGDDLGATTVEFYLDGRLLGAIPQPPYALAWSATPGNHTLRLRALDRAGNVTEVTVTFTVR